MKKTKNTNTILVVKLRNNDVSVRDHCHIPSKCGGCAQKGCIINYDISN